MAWEAWLTLDAMQYARSLRVPTRLVTGDGKARYRARRSLPMTNTGAGARGVRDALSRGSHSPRVFGLPCGGTLQLALEPLGPQSRIAELVERLAAREPVRRTLDLRTGDVTLGRPDRATELRFDVRQLECVLGARFRLLVIGAGQLSRYLCQTAVGLGFDVTVCDPREEYTEPFETEGVTPTRCMPDDVVQAMQPDERTAVIALTHDPKLDDLALMDALKTPAFYVGALGSQANNAKRRERLKEHFDLTDDVLARLHGPAGLYIGSRTPPEIALSILAEIVAAKNGVDIPRQLAVGDAKNASASQPSLAVCTAA